MHHPVRATELSYRCAACSLAWADRFFPFFFGPPQRKTEKAVWSSETIIGGPCPVPRHAGGCELGSLTFVYSYHGYFI